MVTVAPLPALRPRPEHAAAVAAVPYDVVDAAEAAALAEGNPLSFLHVTRPEIDLPEGVDPHSDGVYRAGAAALARFVAQGTLIRDPEPALYLYRLTTADGHTQLGVLGRVSVDDYDAGRIRKHEKTRPDKEDDRTHHLLTLACHPEPVFLTCRSNPEIARRMRQGTQSRDARLYDFTAPDGVRHQVWRRTGAAAAGLSRAFVAVDALYVADGHHRCAAAGRARAVRRDGNPGHTGEEPYNFFLAATFPDDQVRILAYNRVVHDLAGRTPPVFLARLGAVMAVSEGAAPVPAGKGRFSMYLAPAGGGGRWYGLEAPRRAVDAGDPVESLDAAVLQRLVLAPLLAVDDPRTSRRIDFVGGIRGSGELERRVERLAAAGGPAVAFSLHPVSVAELIAVSDAGRVLPPKSTWFEPKLRSGLLVHEL